MRGKTIGNVFLFRLLSSKNGRLPGATVALFALCTLVCPATPVPAQSSAYTNGKAAGLSAAQIKRLSGLKVAVAVPTYVPRGYVLKQVRIPRPVGPGVVDYALVYANARNKTFTLNSTNEGIGDVVVKEEARGRNPYLDGAFYAGHDEEGGGSVGAQWAGSLKRFGPRGAAQQFYSLAADPQSISSREAVRVMTFLRYLKR